MEQQKDNALEVTGLNVEYKSGDEIVRAVNGIDIHLEKGRALGLVGETGAGKTTTCLSILRLIPEPPGKIVGGSIKLGGREILSLSEREMEKVRGKEVSMIFQDPMTALNPSITVGDQIAEVIATHEKVSKEELMKQARDMLELVGIPGERSGDYPHQFSGGMKQRVVIAIALACNPDVLLADEPTTALDVTIQAQVLETIRRLREEYHTAMLLVTHDLGVVAENCDEVSVVYAGRVVEHGTLDDVYNHTRHPYTEGLFNSLPKPGDRAHELKPIAGLMPDPSDLPPGCPFHPRCEYATELCSSQLPPKIYRTPSHFVACHLYNQETVVKGGMIGNV